MPKLTENGKDKLAVTIRERRIYAGQKVEEVLPGPLEDPKPLRTIHQNAVKAALADGLKDHPYFKGDAKKFHSFLTCQWGGREGIRAVMLDDLGVFVEFGHGLPGVRRAGKRGAIATTEWNQMCLEKSIELHNMIAGGTKRMFDVPQKGVQMALFALK